ncbi:MAG: VOC family protein [Candidatus Gracilibacteria bacterium]
MTMINPYLMFDGNCEEAMNFYADALGAEAQIMKVGDSPAAGDFDEASKKRVMHSALMKDGESILLASDVMMEYADGVKYTIGNAMTVCIHCKSEEEIRTFFANLSKGGEVGSEVKTEFWGDMFGMVTDKYGFDWMLNFSKQDCLEEKK